MYPSALRGQSAVKAWRVAKEVRTYGHVDGISSAISCRFSGFTATAQCYRLVEQYH
jgi:hypothetical protein